jgi:hypothetical protein
MSIQLPAHDPIIEKCAKLLFSIHTVPPAEIRRMVSRMFKYLIPEIRRLRAIQEDLEKGRAPCKKCGNKFRVCMKCHDFEVARLGNQVDAALHLLDNAGKEAVHNAYNEPVLEDYDD